MDKQARRFAALTEESLPPAGLCCPLVYLRGVFRRARARHAPAYPPRVYAARVIMPDAAGVGGQAARARAAAFLVVKFAETETLPKRN